MGKKSGNMSLMISDILKTIVILSRLNSEDYKVFYNMENEFVEAGFLIKELHSNVAGFPYDRE